MVDFNDLVPGDYYLHVYIEETIELLNKQDPEKTLDVVIKRKYLPNNSSHLLRERQIEQIAARRGP